MLIVCPNCATSYQVEPSSLGATGRSVRCVRCRRSGSRPTPKSMAAIAACPSRSDIAACSATRRDAGLSEPPARRAAPAGSADGPGSTAEPTATIAARPRCRSPATSTVRPSEPPASRRVTPRRLAPARPATTPPPAAGRRPVPEDIESVRRAPASGGRRHAPSRAGRCRGWGTAILLLIAINVGLIGWRADIVRLLPQTASLYAAIGLPVNLRGLALHRTSSPARKPRTASRCWWSKATS